MKLQWLIIPNLIKFGFEGLKLNTTFFG